MSSVPRSPSAPPRWRRDPCFHWLPLLLLLGARVEQAACFEDFYFKEHFHQLRGSFEEDVPARCMCAGRPCHELASTLFDYNSRSSTFAERVETWKNATGFQQSWNAEVHETLKTDRYSGSSVQLEYDLYGCDCSLCSNVVFGSCAAHVMGCSSHLKSTESCAAQCPPGTRPSQESMHCERGVLSPPAVWCHGEPPSVVPQALRLADADPLRGHVAGPLELELGGRPWRLNATAVHVYLGVGMLRVGQVLLKQAVHWNEQGPLRMWLPRTALTGGATSLVAFYANANGEGSTPAVLPLTDLEVDPPQPSADRPFALRAFGAPPGALRLAVDGSCGASPEPLLRPQGQGLFAASRSGLYAACDCRAGDCLDDAAYSMTIGQVAVSGELAGGLTGEGGTALWPVVGSTFVLEVAGASLGPGHRLRALRAGPGSAVPACGSSGGDVNSAVSGLHGDGLSDPAGANTSLRWQVIAYESGTFQACLSMDFCDGSGPACSELRRASEVPVGSFRVRPCEPPCRTCYGHPRICSSCLDPSHIAQNGTCWPQSRWCAALSNVSGDCKVGSLVRPVVGTDIHPERLVEEFQCASELSQPVESCPDCVMSRTCVCEGAVKFGFDTTWTEWMNVSGSVTCAASTFGEDPLPDMNKVCICRPSDISKRGSLAAPQPADDRLQGASAPAARPRCPCSVKGLPSSFVKSYNPFLEKTCAEDVGDCWSSDAPLRLVDPVGLAVLGPGAVLVADRAHYAAGTVPDRLISLDDIPKGALFRVDLATGAVRYACPACCSKFLYEPRSVRVAPSGAFWLIADSRNHRIRRVDAATLEMTDLAGSGPQQCMNIYPDSATAPAGDGGPATEARLCRTADAAIHHDERRVLLAEAHCLLPQQPAEAGRVRLVDERGVIRHVVKLPLVAPSTIAGQCTQELSNIEWLPGESDELVVACGSIRIFTLGGFETTSRLSQGRSLQDIYMVRVTLDETELLVAARTPSDSGGRLLALPLAGGGGPPRELLLAGGAGGDGWGAGGASWAGPLAVEDIPAAIHAPDGSLVFLAKQQDSSEILQVRPACRPGHGVGPGGSCHVCPSGKYNDGSKDLYGRCESCHGELEDSDPGATRCSCRAGFKRANVTQSCEICQLGNYCPRGVEGAQRCPDWGMTYNGSHPGNFEAYSISQCDCCFGQYRSRDTNLDGRLGSCMTCPEGRWCAGSRMPHLDPPMRLQNGYWLPAPSASVPMDDSVTFRCAHPSHCWWTSHLSLWAASGRATCRNARWLEAWNCSSLHCAGVLAAAPVPAAAAAGAAGTCPGGREGLACGRCPGGSYAPTRSHGCRPCRNAKVQALVASAALLVMVGGLCAALEASCNIRQHVVYSAASSLGIMLVFYEHVRVMHRLTGLRWPAVQEQVMAEIERGLADTLSYLLPVSADCLGLRSLAGRRAALAAAALAPAPALLLLRPLAAAAAALARRSERGGAWEDMHISSSAAANVLGLLACTFVSPLTSSALGFFQCYTHPGTDGRWASLWWSPEVLCTWDPKAYWLAALVPDAAPDAWQEALPIGILVVLLPCAWLALQIFLVRRLPAALSEDHGSERSVGFLAWNRYAWRRLRRHAHFWDLATLMRLLVLHLVVVFEPLGLPVWAQMYVIFTVNLLTLVRVVLDMPFTELAVNMLEGFSLASLLLIITFGIMNLNEEEVDASAQNAINTSMVFAILGFTLFVFSMAIRELFWPKIAATKEKYLIEDFAIELHCIAQTGCEIQTGILVERIDELDMQSIRTAQRSLHYLEQMMMPSSGHQKTEWTRLAAFEDHTKEIDEELENNFQEHGGVQAASMAHKSATGGIVAVLAGDSRSIGGEGGLVSERRSRRTTNSRLSVRLSSGINSLWRSGSVMRPSTRSQNSGGPGPSQRGYQRSSFRSSFRSSARGSVGQAGSEWEDGSQGSLSNEEEPDQNSAASGGNEEPDQNSAASGGNEEPDQNSAVSGGNEDDPSHCSETSPSPSCHDQSAGSPGTASKSKQEAAESASAEHSQDGASSKCSQHDDSHPGASDNNGVPDGFISLNIDQA